MSPADPPRTPAGQPIHPPPDPPPDPGADPRRAAWAAPVPRCPRHAHMTYDRRTRLWTCRGWDGEGCGHTEDAAEIDWLDVGPLSEAEIIHTTGGLL